MNNSRWTIIGEPFNKNNRKFYNCVCDCGKNKSVRYSHIISGASLSCGCLAKEKTSKRKTGGYKDLGGQYWANIKYDSLKRNIDFQLTVENAYDIFIRQNCKCPYTGIELYFGDRKIFNRDRNCSLDRIDSNNGYYIDNCEWIYKPLNCMKRCLSKQKFINLCKLSISPIKQIYLGNIDEDTITKTLYTNIKNIAERRRIRKFLVSREYLIELFRKQLGLCSITGLQLYIPQTTKDFLQFNKRASLDRIDSHEGYIDGNVQWVDYDVNIMKRQYSMEEFISICKLVRNYNE